MVLVRNVFQLKFGKAREAVAALKEGIAIQKRLGLDVNQRLFTDLSGPFYTLVLEVTVPDLAALEATLATSMGDAEFQASYQKFAALVDSGHREMFHLVE